MSPARKNGDQAEAFITCRTLRHAWDPIAPGDRRPLFGTLATLRCDRCGTIRYDKFSRITGDRLGNPQYVYPDGYRGEPHPMSWWRASWAERMYDLGLTVDGPDPT
jgi:hypothetical protein